MEEKNWKEQGGKGQFLIRKRSLAIILILALLLGGAGGAFCYRTVVQRDGMTVVSTENYSEMQQICQKYEKLEMLYQYLNSRYYKELDPEKMMIGIYKGLFESTGDPYTQYLTPEEYEKALETATGDFFGVGVSMTAADGKIVVMSTMEGSPAEQAGIQTGDCIVAVDGVSYSGTELNEAAAAMRGALNTKVTISYQRGDQLLETTLVRKKITTQSVYSRFLSSDIGYIRITSFETSTAADFETELHRMEVSGASGVVIDVRNNGGGIVDSGLAIADMLLPEGTMIYLEDRNGDRVYKNSDENCTSLPYVLLVNGGTASTSEILAAAIKDNHGGKLVGEQTFGKGIVQSLEQLNDGSGALKITVQQYFSPNGKTIHGVGVSPDYEVSLPQDAAEDTQLEKAVELLK